MKVVSLAVLIAIMAGLLGCAEDLVAPSVTDSALEQGEAFGKMGYVPFKVEMEWTVTLMLAPGFPVGLSTFDGRCSRPSTWFASYTLEGIASHLGMITGEGSHCALVEFGPGGEIVDASGSDAVMTLVAANGDQLVLDRTETGTGILENGDPWWIELWSVQSGTGRFEGAEGNGSAYGVSSQDGSHPPYLTMEGTLSY